MEYKQYEWAVIGSGIAGIISSEILTREGHSTVLIEKNDKLASETTRDFHEWMHAGSLYTLIPDNLRTLKFILGAIDDLFDFYSYYNRMNLEPSLSGLNIENMENGWFNPENYIHFKFRIKGRKITFPWLIGVARAVFLIEKISEHDWLRRRAGVLDPFKLKIKDLFKIIIKLIKTKTKFYTIKTPDFTMNSRSIIQDMVATSIKKGMTISTSNIFLKYEKLESGYIVHCEKESFLVQNIVLCNGENSVKYLNAKVKKSYAPMAIVNNINSDSKSFVELDYYPKNCINIITKENGIGLIGGISFNDRSKCDPYIEEIIRKHKKYQPKIKLLHKYIGTKSEIIIDGEPRNYLYHILENSDGVWTIIPGKFSLGFSIGPEFYRRVYKRNPKKHISTTNSKTTDNNIISNTVWQDTLNNLKTGDHKNGND